MTVSVICPVYNSAPYIEACIASLRAQTMPDYEVLLVDDHGLDDAMDVARRCAAGDGRFRFLQTAVNAGPGEARNVGLDAAQGQYVAFIDSDDQWHPNFLKAMVEKADMLADFGPDGYMQGGDLVYCQLQYRGGARDGQVVRNPVMPDGSFSDDERRRFLTRFRTFSVCFLYRRRFLDDHQIRFPRSRSSEDTYFLTKALLCAQKVACVDEPYYYYCCQDESLTQRRDETRYECKMQTMELLVDDLRRSGLYDDSSAEVIDYLFAKKGFAVAAFNYLQAAQHPSADVLRSLARRLDLQTPRWRTNGLLRSDRKVCGAVILLHDWPWLSARLLPIVARRMML